MKNILFRIISALLIVWSISSFFLIDITQQWAFPAILIILSVLFLIASLKLELALFASLCLLPVFFLLDNIQEIDQVYNISFGQNLTYIPIDVRSIGFFITVFFAVLVVIKNKKNLSATPLSKIIPISIGLLCLSAIWSRYPHLSIVQVGFYLLLGTTFFVSFFVVKNAKNLIYLFLILLTYSIPTILLAYYQLLSGLLYYHSDIGLGRVTGPFDRANQFGNYLFIMIVISTLLIFAIKNKHAIFNKIAIIYLVLSLPIFILTFSRSSWIAMIIFFGIFLTHKKQVFASGLIALTLLGGVLLSFESTRERINGFFQRSMFDSVYAREEVWRLSYERFKESPLIGYGAGSFPEIIRDAKESGSGTDNPHNDIVFFAVEAGIIGIFSYLLFTIGFYYYLIKYWASTKKEDKITIKIFKENTIIKPKIIALGILALMISTSIISMVESHFEGNIYHIFIWLIFGAWFSISQSFLKNKNKTSSL